MIRLVLTDDHKIIRDGVKSLLADEPAIEVIGEACNGEELLQFLAHTAADMVLLDINMPGRNGFQVAAQLKAHHPDIKILALSMLDHENYIGQMLDAGASGFLLKNAGRAELIHAIHTVARGEKYICTEISLNLLRKLRGIASDKPGSFLDMAETPSMASAGQARARGNTNLSKREIEVLELITQGLTTGDIAEKLFTSRRTIETHRQNLLDKTQCNNTAALVRFAVSEGLVQ